MSPQLSGHRAPHITPLVIAHAIVDSGGTAAPNRSTWLEVVESFPWRSDYRQTVLDVAKTLALNADARLCAAPGVENLGNRAHLARRRTYRVLRRLRDEGFLGWVTTGATGLRSGNWRATYVLTIPPGVDLPPDPDEKVSPRRDSSHEEDPRARARHWTDSPALAWVRRRYAASWTERQFWTALTYPTDMTRPYGPPTGSSLWRVLAWRVAQRSEGGRFVGPEALGVVPGSWVPPRIDHRAEWAEWETEMAKPGAREACAVARAECVRIVREATRAKTPGTKGSRR